MNKADNGKEATPRPAREIVRHLISDRKSERAEGDSSARADAGDHLYRELSRWVGRDGCHALFSRALVETRKEYASLGQIQLNAGSEPYIGGVAETVMAYGEAATANALESLLVRLVELLGRLIGDDMAGRLIESSALTFERPDSTANDKGEKT